MNAAEKEISEAIRKAQVGPWIIRQVCMICRECLQDWDVHKGFAICWSCRSVYFPAPKVEEKKEEPRKATLFRLQDGKYMVLLD